MMIKFDPQKYMVRDDDYEKECNKRVDQLYKLFQNKSFFGYIQCSELSEKLSIVLQKNNEDYTRYYKENYVRFSKLMENLSWEIIEPYTEFERSLKKITSEIQELLKNRNYSLNKNSREKISILESLIIDYGRNTKIPDYITRCRFHNKLNEIKRKFKSDSLISYLTLSDSLTDLKRIYEENIALYKKHFIPVLKQLNSLKPAFEKSQTYFSIKEAKMISEQIEKSEKLIYGDSYDDLITASDILSAIDSKLSNLSLVKKVKIEENINSQMQILRRQIWKEDWEDINNAVKVMISEAENSGQLYQLNLDKFNIEHKKREKKEQIFQFIKNAESKRIFRSAEIVVKARNLLSSEASRKDLEELLKATSQQDRCKEKQTRIEKKPNSKIKYSLYLTFLSTVLTILIINYHKNIEHFEEKGNSYADILETMVYAQLKNKNEIDIESIRKKPVFQNNDLKIISIDDQEVVIEYRNKIYKKNIRKK